MLEHNAYGNIPIYSPDGILMFNTNDRKVNFYKRHNLIEEFNSGFKLLFKPSGLGLHDRSAGHLLSFPRKNRCVISGEEDVLLLTRHHIVPVLFRKWMPEHIKSANYQFIVFVRKDLHHKYTKYEHEYYSEIAKMFGVDVFEDTLFLHASQISKRRKLANTLYKYGHFIPKDRMEVLKTKFKIHCGYEPTYENYKKVCEEIEATEKKYYKNADYNFGKLVIEKITDYEAFENIWFTHFLSKMKPEFLPEDLKLLIVKRDINVL